MATNTHTLTLNGCAPVPLAHYLKALGILRLVAEQVDPQARGWWQGDTFRLRSQLDEPALMSFLLDAYVPTPIIAPWNGGSGFNPKDNVVAISAIANGNASRLEPYRQAVETARTIRQSLGLTDKVDKDDKPALLQRCRAELADAALPWLDAAYLLTEGGAKYPPLLGTGGNDGRLDFTNNFMQRLCDLVDPENGSASAAGRSWLPMALLGRTDDGLQKGNAIGQFYPGANGGPNGTSGFGAESLINPWDFVLMIEGSLLFAAASSKRLESAQPGVLSYPFNVHTTSAGYGSAAASDEGGARSEMWLPLWGRPTSVNCRLSLLRGVPRSALGLHGTDWTSPVPWPVLAPIVVSTPFNGMASKSAMAWPISPPR